MPRGWLGSYSHPETVRTMDDVINFPHPPTPHPPGEPLSHRLRGTTVVSQYCPVVRCSEGSFREHRDISTADTSRGRYQQPVHPVCRTSAAQILHFLFFGRVWGGTVKTQSAVLLTFCTTFPVLRGVGRGRGGGRDATQRRDKTGINRMAELPLQQFCVYALTLVCRSSSLGLWHCCSWLCALSLVTLYFKCPIIST